MTGRRDRERDRDRKEERREEAPKPRKSVFFVPGTGIHREVITTDICRYLGNDALVRPGPYEDPRTGEVRQGYFVTAYRALTTEQLTDLKEDSLRWQQERQRNPQASRAPTGGISSRDSPDYTVRNSNLAADGYRGSVTRRQQWGAADQPAPEPARYPGQDALPRAEIQQPYGGQAQQYPGNPGMMQPPRGYPGVPNSYNPIGSMDAQPTYSYETRPNPNRAEANYEFETEPAPRGDPRYPSVPGYAGGPGLPGGRGNPSPGGFPGYPSNPEYGGVTSPPLPGVRPPTIGRGYETYGAQPPPDALYGRNQPAAQPAPEGDFANADYDEGDDHMDEDGADYTTRPQEARRPEAPRPRDPERTERTDRPTREAPPLKSSRTQHSDRDRHRR